MSLNANDHARAILAAIVPHRRDLLDSALRHLGSAHFMDPVLRNLFTMLERYMEVTGAVMSRESLYDLLRGKDEGAILLYCETFDALVEQQVDDAKFRWSVAQLRELAAESATTQALTDGRDILLVGREDTQGQSYRGHADARSFVMQAFADIERELQLQDAPEGNLRNEQDVMLADYAQRQIARASGRPQGVLLGIDELDTRIGGLQPGELDLFIGFTSAGKTTLVTQTAWHAMTQQKLNVVFMTTETLRPQVSRKIISRHSCLSQFGLLPDGLNTRALKEGTLNPADELKLQEVIDDFTRNPSYGNFYLLQLPGGATMSMIGSKLLRVSRMFHVDLCVIDYLGLLMSERKRQQQNSELSDIVKAAKVLAATFNEGQGVPIVSPWQVSRAAYEEALKTGSYTLRALSETSEAEKSSDVIISLLGKVEDESRRAALTSQILKNRDGERASGIELSVDFATCRVEGKRTSKELEGLLKV